MAQMMETGGGFGGNDYWSNITFGINNFMGNLFEGGSSSSSDNTSKLADIAKGGAQGLSTADGAVQAGLTGLLASGGNPMVAVGSAIVGGLMANKRAKLIKIERERQERELKAQKKRMETDRKLKALAGLQDTLRDVISL